MEGSMVHPGAQGRQACGGTLGTPTHLSHQQGGQTLQKGGGRLAFHMSSVDPDLEFCQFGFRPGRSTVGAIRRLRSLVDRAVSRDMVVVAVSLNMFNAFNTLP